MRMHNHYQLVGRNYCAFCGVQNRVGPDDRRILLGAPMLRMDLWRRIAGSRWREVMCLPCMRQRLGRPFLTNWDAWGVWWQYQRLPSQSCRACAGPADYVAERALNLKYLVHARIRG